MKVSIRSGGCYCVFTPANKLGIKQVVAAPLTQGSVHKVTYGPNYCPSSEGKYYEVSAALLSQRPANTLGIKQVVTAPLTQGPVHKVPRRPVLSDIQRLNSVAKVDVCEQQDRRRSARPFDFPSPLDSSVSVESNETLYEPTSWKHTKAIDIVGEHTTCEELNNTCSAPIDQDDDKCSKWSFESGNEAAFICHQIQNAWSEVNTEAAWTSLAASWALPDCPIEIDEASPSIDSHCDVTLVESHLKTSSSTLAGPEDSNHSLSVAETTSAKVDDQTPCAIADAPTTEGSCSIDSLDADVVNLSKGLPQSIVSGSLQADPESELLKTAPLAPSSEPIAQTTSDDLVIPVEGFDKSKTSLFLTRVKAKMASFTGIGAPISRSTLMFNGVQTATYANPPPCSQESLTKANKTYRLDGGAFIKAYSPIVYHYIRTLCGIDYQEFLNSFVLHSDLTKTKSPGKSGSDFLFTPDGKYIIKTIKRKEHKVISNVDFLGDYYNHIKAHPSTQLPFYLGNYTLLADGKKTHFVVMKNLLQKETELIYDLKGSSHGRHAGPRKDNRGRVVFKDLDWIDKNEAISMTQEDRDKLMVQVSKDVDLLMRHNIMDYSLLVGLQTDTGTCEQRPVIGMIDTLCPFGWRKRAENLSKSLFLGASAIDVVHPEKYGTRFLNFVQSAVIPGPGRSVSTHC
ncbi:1-phosphatidylinositol-4-phosphate 5-kinase [Sugiyamaella lignohabitans]|uniref:1-phosphatidylinositol-4-phosphate 5-kinase n=1 Tax=Sugiyamaella lignohabitans TaxID=796027 RepID=A0A167CLA9_9ASCO|nr:1-phosphatidylinositol-4-phosphate 5-kinase [Sugiyamaella lignohabitans]ANB11845.1 1-phosphatidylinositol-4-phosphate 5-kinase [Sugiyamaella lignohabitans]